MKEKPLYYRLNADGSTEPCSIYDLEKMYRDPNARIIKQEQIGKCFISTVFLGIDHSYAPDAPPLLFETMIFGPENTDIGYQTRYSTKQEAEEGHKEACRYALDLLCEAKNEKNTFDA